MNKITSRDLARHARLFELLRQQNIARATRKKMSAAAIPEMLDHFEFKQMAQRSL